MKLKTTLIRVTAEDIATGKKNDCWACPIAKAVTRTLRLSPDQQMPGRFSVGGNYVRIERQKYTLPRSAIRFIRRFDSEQDVEPFRFKLSHP